MRKRGKLNEEVVVSPKEQESAFRVIYAPPTSTSPSLTPPHDLRVTSSNITQNSDEPLRTENREPKTLGAKVISQHYRHGLIRGVRTKHQLMNPSPDRLKENHKLLSAQQPTENTVEPLITEFFFKTPPESVKLETITDMNHRQKKQPLNFDPENTGFGGSYDISKNDKEIKDKPVEYKPSSSNLFPSESSNIEGKDGLINENIKFQKATNIFEGSCEASNAPTFDNADQKSVDRPLVSDPLSQPYLTTDQSELCETRSYSPSDIKVDYRSPTPVLHCISEPPFYYEGSRKDFDTNSAVNVGFDKNYFNEYENDQITDSGLKRRETEASAGLLETNLDKLVTSFQELPSKRVENVLGVNSSLSAPEYSSLGRQAPILSVNQQKSSISSINNSFGICDKITGEPEKSSPKPSRPYDSVVPTHNPINSVSSSLSYSYAPFSQTVFNAPIYTQTATSPTNDKLMWPQTRPHFELNPTESMRPPSLVKDNQYTTKPVVSQRASEVGNLTNRFRSLELDSVEQTTFRQNDYDSSRNPHFYDPYQQYLAYMNSIPGFRQPSTFSQPLRSGRPFEGFPSHPPHSYYPNLQQSYYLNYSDIAFAKWQEDYAKWCEAYREEKSRQHSVHHSTLSSIGFNPQRDAQSIDAYSFNPVSRGRCWSPEQSALKQTSTDTRTTPPLPTTCVFANFNPDGSLLISNGLKHSLVSVSTLELKKDSDFPGPLHGLNRRLLLNYMTKVIDNIPEGCLKLLWEILCVFIRADGSPDLSDLCEPLVRCCRNGIFKTFPPTLVGNEGYSGIVEALLNNDLKGAVRIATDSQNWTIALGLASLDGELCRRTLKKYTDSLDPQDLVRSFLCLRANLPLDPANLSATSLDEQWTCYLVFFLSQSPASDCVSNLSALLRALRAKNRPEPCLIVSVLLDLALNVQQSDEMFWPSHSLRGLFCDPSYFDLLHFRTVEIYESIKLVSRPSFCSPFLQMYKTLYAELLASTNKELAFEYVETVSKSLLKNPLCDYSHGFIQTLNKLARRLFFSLSHSSTRPDWLAHLENATHSYPNTDPFPQPQNTPLVSQKTDQPPSEIPLSLEKPCQNPVKFEPSLPILHTLPKTQTQTNSSIIKNSLDKISESKNDYPQFEFKGPSSLPAVSDNISILARLKEPTITKPVLPAVCPAPHFSHPSASDSRLHQQPQIPQQQAMSVSEPRINSKPYVSSAQPAQALPKDVVSASITPDASKSTLISNVGKFFRLLKPRAEINLPDDKKPSIVFDEATNRYVNLNAESDSSSSRAPPPPPKIITYLEAGRALGQSVSKGPSLKPTKDLYIPPTY